ncbi:hypothetical protein Tfont_02297 [Tepidimonas fonticaldi]|uniref:Uncharacterized protein n=1 Tax=Tepidimonas fonticaldi TaxID=1101373 RepID=A0A554XHM8_9BURK|nr:hypothetical protein [Tepidimonas fonticaldi]TSE35323.1 hypothetical protein Tfont_02297 [Tepidimonas fonticaldi]
MTELQRITTEYSEAEDRLRLAGEDAQGQTVVLWLTQRLLSRLVAHLCRWLEQQGGNAPLVEVRQEFAQQKARAELAPQPPVRADAETQGVLVHSVDLKRSRAGLVLHFKGVGGNVVASLKLQPKPLRQWLNIVYDQYLQAGWPTTVWPAWVAEAKPAATPARAAVLH